MTTEQGDGEWVAADDSAVGRAFRLSLIVVGLGAAIGGGGWWWATRSSKAPIGPVVAATAPESKVTPKDTVLPAIPFADRTTALGIEFVRESGARGEKLLPETMGGGVAFFDCDNDGWEDLFLVDGMPWPHAAPRPEADRPRCRLYLNEGGHGFRDVSSESGADITLQGMGVACGDYDGDGRVDLFLTAVGSSVLLRNVGVAGAPAFEDVTSAAGVGGNPTSWGSSAGFFDLDRDGDLDLVVLHYVKWSREIDFEVDYRLTGIGRAYGPPTNFEGTDAVLYRNNGDGTFTDVSVESGIQVRNPATGVPVGKALALGALDLDGDGWLDLVIANDKTQNFVFRNRGGAGQPGRFEEIGAVSGLAFDRNGNATGAMGIDGADVRNDQTLAVAIGNFANEMTSFFVSRSGGDGRVLFSDDAVNEGIGGPTRLALSFGLFFLDADLDGRLDLLQANGHIEDQIEVTQPSQRYAQSAQLFWNRGSEPDSAGHRASFVELPKSLVGDLATPIVGRGAAYADIDHDGDLDVVITQPLGSPLLLLNQQDLGHHWLRIRLSDPESRNRHAIGARIELVAGGVTQRRQVMPTKSYLSQCELPVTFGLGEQESIESIRVLWPDGQAESIALEGGVDRTVDIVRGTIDRSAR